MNKFIAFFLSSVAVFISTTAVAQQSVNDAHLKNDIGFFVTPQRSMPSIEYRFAVNDNYKLRLGLDFISENNFFQQGPVVFASDSLVTNQYRSTQNIKPAFRFGFDRQLAVKYFSLGLDLQVRYTNQKINYSNVNSVLNENGDWEIADLEDFAPLVEEIAGPQVTNHFLQTAVRGNLTAQFPLGNNYLLAAYYAATAGPSFFLKATDRIDPQNQIPSSSGVAINFESFVGVGIRYLFKEKVGKEK